MNCFFQSSLVGICCFWWRREVKYRFVAIVSVWLHGIAVVVFLFGISSHIVAQVGILRQGR